MSVNQFSESLIRWYEQHRRELPWRETKDPYRIWISEIILQQTRVAQGYAYYCRFIERFPDVCSLAEAHEDAHLLMICLVPWSMETYTGCFRAGWVWMNR